MIDKKSLTNEAGRICAGIETGSHVECEQLLLDPLIALLKNSEVALLRFLNSRNPFLICTFYFAEPLSCVSILSSYLSISSM